MAVLTRGLLSVSQEPWCFNRKAAATALGMLCAALLPLQLGQSSFVALITAHQLCTAWVLATMHSPMCVEIRQVSQAFVRTLQDFVAHVSLCECR